MSVSTPPATIRPTGRVVACAADPAAQRQLELAIRRNGYDAIAVSSLEQLRDLALDEEIAAAVIDEPQSIEQVQQLDSELRRLDRPTQLVLLPSIGQRMSLPKSLTCEVVDPPLTPERIGRALFAAVGRAQLITENLELRQKLEGRMFDGLIGFSGQTREMRNQIHFAAEHDQPVLVVGEVGCGKSEAARAIHLTRSGPSKPLLTIRCQLLTSAAVEKELFGDEDCEGRISAASDGTLVLEDIDSLTLPVQAKLAAAIRNSAYKRGENFVPVRSRIIATSSANLRKLCAEQKFDLRLAELLERNVISVAPLRERIEDVACLAEHFLQQASVREGQHPRRLSNEALNRLETHNWPGNVRELENVMNRICSLAGNSDVTVEELLPWLEQSEDSAEAPGMTLREMERKLIEATFNRFGGNRELTAKALQIGIRTLSGKLREYGYPPRGGPGSNRKQDRAA
ncbi:Nitrogen fixation protein VnfA [Thalassoglobus neptunius]|uniref:Nitrogen fixation protein VnfA n=1 Tax=Thalassoglobus neptunius TaxID=1938619 RepID=A0A5C5WNY9_9PLAN|nr:sigma 54-interacting transcriptional regulator [Thalassoglobus neptunius]TWT51532.1 Nitrogen fixation protein VnfA [Thalassoglobus neptunius]